MRQHSMCLRTAAQAGIPKKEFLCSQVSCRRRFAVCEEPAGEASCLVAMFLHFAQNQLRRIQVVSQECFDLVSVPLAQCCPLLPKCFMQNLSCFVTGLFFHPVSRAVGLENCVFQVSHSPLCCSSPAVGFCQFSSEL